MSAVSASGPRQRLLVISPVYNEGQHLDRTARAIAAQDHRPDRWIIIDDGSSDDTLAIARRWERELDFVTVMETATAEDGPDRLALAREARAFNLALRAAGDGFTHVGKLDGDVELTSDWFATLLERFAAEPALGLIGGRLAEPGPGGWAVIPIPDTHIHGAVKLYSRECLTTIGGMQERLAWDTIDEIYARLRGYEARSLPELVGRHHRPWGSADGRLRGKARHGECSWILHQGLGWACLRALKLSRISPVVLSGLAFLYGYVRAAARRTPRVEDPEFRSFVRSETRARLRRGRGGPATHKNDAAQAVVG